MSKFYCLLCSDGPHDEEKLANHDCPEAFKHGFKVVNGRLEIHRTRWRRFVDWFFKYNWGRFFRFTGFFMVYSVLMSHFNVHLSWWEGALVGIGMGLYIE